MVTGGKENWNKLDITEMLVDGATSWNIITSAVLPSVREWISAVTVNNVVYTFGNALTRLLTQTWSTVEKKTKNRRSIGIGGGMCQSL